MDEPVIQVLTRSLAEAHVDRILGLLAAIPGRSWSREELLTDRPDKFELSRLWLAASKVVGVVIVSSKGDVVHIHQVAFQENYRRAGLGHKSYGEIAAVARDKGIFRLTANCILSDAAAMAFHNSLGFTQHSSYIDPEDKLEYARLAATVDEVLKRSGRL